MVGFGFKSFLITLPTALAKPTSTLLESSN